MKRLSLIDKSQYLFNPVKGIYSKYFKKYLNGVLSDTGYIKVSLNCIDGKKIGKYKSAHQASRDNGFNRGNICNCCNNIIKTYKGYKWSYEPL